MFLLSCPTCGESVEVPEFEPDEESHPLTCPVCGSYVQEDELTVAVTIPEERVPPRRKRR